MILILLLLYTLLLGITHIISIIRENQYNNIIEDLISNSVVYQYKPWAFMEQFAKKTDIIFTFSVKITEENIKNKSLWDSYSITNTEEVFITLNLCIWRYIIPFIKRSIINILNKFINWIKK